MTDEQPAGDEPVTVLQAALDALPDDQVDVVTILLARAAALPPGILAYAIDVGEREVLRLRPEQPIPTFPGDRVPPRQTQLGPPEVEDFVGRTDIEWPCGT